MLEAAVLQHGLTWASLSVPTKTALKRSSSAAIKLWDSEMAWHSPMPTFSLHTTPGITYNSPSLPPAQDFMIRWCLSYIDNEGRKGRSVATGDGWTQYLANPEPTYPQTLVPYCLIVASSHNPVTVDATPGNTVLCATSQVQARQISPPNPTINKELTVTRKGVKVRITPSTAFIKKISLPKPTAPPKYSTVPLPQFKLSPSALPPGTPQCMIDSATRAFAASVSQSTQATYKTALGHLHRAEALLGRQFSTPPTDQEIIFFTSFLASKAVTKATMQSYLSALRFISRERGATHHTKLPELGSQMLAGSANIKKDALVEATKPKRRPITINMLVLLQHGIASQQSWSPHEKSLRWSCMLLAYWGSFRMGELLETEKSKFNPGTSLLPSDIKFQEGSVAIWVRCPKIWKEGGDVVEVWSVKENEQLDPVIALTQFISLRAANLGPAEKSPVFLHENGSLFTKAEMNKDIKLLLAMYPTLSSPRDLWSGHSFRAGIATLLTSLGFTEEQVKKWGRWSSIAYMAYVQDQSKRRETRHQFTQIFGQMLASI